MSINSGEITMQLSHPLTEEQWDIITDADLEHTNSMWFHTKHGKDVEFVKVVRCKDCKWCRLYQLFGTDNYQCERSALSAYFWVEPTDFCSYGECIEVKE